MYMKKLLAFTLSEVLITLGIIGVVAALTVPNLVTSYQRKAQTVQLRKTISEIENALDLLITEEGKTSLAQTSIAEDDGVSEFFKNHMRIIKSCSSTETSNCFASENYTSIDGSRTKAFSCAGTSYVLANSAAVCANKTELVAIEAKEKNSDPLTPSTSTPFFQMVSSGLNIELYIDTNGSAPPNIGGRDMFLVYIKPDGTIVSSVATNDTVCTLNSEKKPVCVEADKYTIEDSTCESSAFGSKCFAKILDSNWEMNY